MAVSEHLSIKESEGFDQKTKFKYIETLASLTCLLKDILFSMDTFLLVKTAQTLLFCAPLYYITYIDFLQVLQG